ncbi:MAG: ORF52 protein [Psittacine adenovirus 12]
MSLFLSLIMHPVRFPVLCGAYTNTLENIRSNGMDENTAAHALGEFFSSPILNTLYIVGPPHGHGERFYCDLRGIMQSEPDIAFIPYSDTMNPTTNIKRVVRVSQAVEKWPTSPNEHRIMTFPLIDRSYRPISRDDFCCYLYCGNTEDGPYEGFRCKNRDGQLCIRRRFGGGPSCGRCFWVPMKKRLKAPYPPLRSEDMHMIDEGCVAEPLGVWGRFYRTHFSDTESEGPDSGDEIPSEAEW